MILYTITASYMATRNHYFEGSSIVAHYSDETKARKALRQQLDIYCEQGWMKSSAERRHSGAVEKDGTTVIFELHQIRMAPIEISST